MVVAVVAVATAAWMAEVVIGMAGKGGGEGGSKGEQVVFVPYAKKPLQQSLLREDKGGQARDSDGPRAWPRLSDPGLLVEPALVGNDGGAGTGTDSAKADEWDIHSPAWRATTRKLRSCPAGALTRCGWRHCCCIVSTLLLLIVTALLVLYFRVTNERQLALPPPPPGLIRPPAVPSTPSLDVQLITYLGVRWTPPETTGGAAVLNYVVETGPTIGGPFSVVSTLVSSANYYGTGGLSGAETLCFRVSAANNAGLGNASLANCFETLPPGAPMPPNSLFPTSATSETSIGLGWTPGNGSGVAILSYELQSCDESVSGAGVCGAGDDGAYAPAYAGLDLSFTAGDLAPESRFWWRVRSVTALGPSIWGPEPPLRLRTDSAGATAPAQPASPSASAVTSDAAEVEWPEVAEEDDGGAQVLEYVLTVDLTTRRQDSAENNSGLLSSGHRRPPQSLMPTVDGFRGFATSYQVADLPADSDFCVELEVLNNLGSSAASTRFCDTTEEAPPPTAPQSVWVANTSSIGVIVGWSPAGGNGAQITSYRVEMDDWWDDEGGEPVFYVVADTPGTEQQALVVSHTTKRPGDPLLPSMPLRCVHYQVTLWTVSVNQRQPDCGSGRTDIWMSWMLGCAWRE